MNLNHITDVNEANEEIKNYKEGNLCLNGLQSAEGLVLPNKIGGSLCLDGLQPSEKTKLKKQYPNLNII
jgi:hypothetical protein